MSSVSPVTPTPDEERHGERAATAALSLGPVFVLDSGSRDRTRELAVAAGATVVEHPWEGYSAQKNWALEHLPLETEWVLFLDADEIVTEALRAELVGTVRQNGFDGYYLPRRFVFLGRELRHAWWYPDYQLRLFRRGKARYEDRLVHEHVLLEGNAGFLREALLHENLKGIDAFVDRHRRYAALEAAEILKARRGATEGQRPGRFLGTWPERRRALKTRVWHRLPGRPVIRFLWMYVLRRGFLDGRQGLIYSQLIAFHEALVNANLFEQEAAAEAMRRRGD